MKHVAEIKLVIDEKQVHKRKEFHSRAKNHIPYWIDKWIKEIKNERGLPEVEIISVTIDNKNDITEKVLNLRK
ncbi:hypothetical protein N5C46_23095 [Rossellomorea vietnamensis]|uniref:Uncharacterized protein n=1 Tax=Rossellomorea vietnamensis TaxID=218284 RepID=A0ACD4C750_9BACI|nr:hypothetical protein [Rossellomorea vietnamensis]UXH44466.1 hypothetical protein N5C46_23095 [Rossellomorea vietnamensis]